MNKSELFRYLISGLINTTVSYVLFFILNNIYMVNIYYSNFLSYMAGMVSSFFINKYFVFIERSEFSLFTFIKAFLIAYSLNLIILKLMLIKFSLQVNIVYFISLLAYSSCFYIYIKLFAFKKIN